jgi:hypothetical protein
MDAKVLIISAPSFRARGLSGARVECPSDVDRCVDRITTKMEALQDLPKPGGSSDFWAEASSLPL